MLTEEVLKANESLKDLTAEQIQTIATLSENDENTVIGQKFGEVYRQMDATIEMLAAENEITKDRIQITEEER